MYVLVIVGDSYLETIFLKGWEQEWHDDIRRWYRFLNYTIPFFVRHIFIIPFLLTVFNNNNNNNNIFFLIRYKSNSYFGDK